jgi:hypothetical protein
MLNSTKEIDTRITSSPSPGLILITDRLLLFVKVSREQQRNIQTIRK